MEKQHLTYFKIENFKRFDSFEMSNLGQFNLIVGDNNVGKTSVLEALLFDEDAVKFVNNFADASLYRDEQDTKYGYTINVSKIPNTEFWNTIFRNTAFPIKFYKERDAFFLSAQIIKTIELNEEDVQLITRKSIEKVPKEWLKLINNTTDQVQLSAAYLEDFISGTSSPFVSANLGYGNDLVEFFFEYFNADNYARREFVECLKLLVPNLEEVKVHRFIANRDMLGLSLKNQNNLIALTQYGDGTVKLTRLLMEILVAQNYRLMVDEIGAGIHFTRLKDYWKTVIQLCAQYNVQLFATTHSLECQQAFIEALEDSEMQQYQKDARNISLIENKQGEVQAITYDFEQFEYALNIGFNTRGGKA